MLYIEFKDKEGIGFKKFSYARVLARIIREMKWLRGMIRHTDSKIKIDYKVILK